MKFNAFEGLLPESYQVATDLAQILSFTIRACRTQLVENLINERKFIG